LTKVNSILADYGTTIFTVMSELAVEHKSINLGQGFPDTDGPADILNEAIRAIKHQSNQYPPMMGIPELRQAAAEHSKIFFNIDLDWKTQTIITSGATEAIAACLFGLIEPGDEVVLIEPLYDCYLPMIRRAGAIPKLVRIEPPNWELPQEKLKAAFSPKTKLILFNSPTNPAAKVYSINELEFIADLVKEHDAYAICDEVYEHLVYDGRQHIPLISLPEMAERCVRISSAGKTFSMTGWKVGYSVGAAKLINAASKAHQFLTFTTPPNLQAAVAFGLKKDLAYFKCLGRDMKQKRDRLSAGLEKIGFEVMDGQGTYFLVADYAPLGFKMDDVEFCKMLTIEAGVTAVPFSAFYQAGSKSGVNHFLRFCYCKENNLIDAALERLSEYLNKTPSNRII
jgi:N-succinyldiaminopimelate aminotransferase